MAELAARAPQFVKVRTPEPERLAGILRGAGMAVALQPDGSLSVTGADTGMLAERATAAGIALHELTPEHASLEDVFMALTRDSIEYEAAATTTRRSS
jgi:ABC-2 type transport system ATP-binding protein